MLSYYIYYNVFIFSKCGRADLTVRSHFLYIKKLFSFFNNILSINGTSVLQYNFVINIFDCSNVNEEFVISNIKLLL